MAVNVGYLIPNGTASTLATRVSAAALIPYQPYFLTDTQQLAIATSTNTRVLFNPIDSAGTQRAAAFATGSVPIGIYSIATDGYYLGAGAFYDHATAASIVMKVAGVTKGLIQAVSGGVQFFGDVYTFYNSAGTATIAQYTTSSGVGVLSVPGNLTVGGGLAATGDVTGANVGKGFEGGCSGKPAANETIGLAQARYPMTLAEGTATIKALTAATSSYTITVKKNGSNVGTIAFSASGSTGTLDFTSGTTLAMASGDVLSLHGPGTADATLADITWVLKAT